MGQRKVFVVGESANSFTGKKGLVNERILQVMDDDAAEGCKDPTVRNYILNQEEFQGIPVGACDRQVLTLCIAEDLFVGGRYKLRGRISSADRERLKPQVKKAA